MCAAAAVFIPHPKLIIYIKNATRNGNFQVVHIEPARDHPVLDIQKFCGEYFGYFAELLRERDDGRSYKLHGRMKVSYIKINAEGEVEQRATDWLITHTFLSADGYSTVMSYIAHELNSQAALFEKGGSGWIFETMHEFNINRAVYRLVGHRGRCEILPELPKNFPIRSIVRLERIKDSKLNIGPNCFVDAVTIGGFLSEREETLPPVQNPRRPSAWMKAMSEEGFGGLDFNHARLKSLDGVDALDCCLFENNNPDYFITVIGSGGGSAGFYILRRFNYQRYAACKKNGRNPKIIFLLLFKEHYFAIKSLDMLLKKDYTHKRFYCSFCLEKFKNAYLRDGHMENCNGTFIRSIAMPPTGSYLNFKQYQNSCQRHPWAIYADSECYHQMVDGEEEEARDEDAPPPKKKAKPSSTKVLDKHMPIMMAYYVAFDPAFEVVLKTMKDVKRLLPEYPSGLYKEFRGPSCGVDFLNSLLDLTERLQGLMRYIKLPLSGAELARGRRELNTNDVVCCICNRGEFNDEDDNKRRVLDHCHWTGRFRGIAHNECNLMVRQQRRFFPVFFHNFRGYDCHILCTEAKFNQPGRNINISTIPMTSEKYLSLSLKWKVDSFEKDEKVIDMYNEIRFLDSLQFLSSGLAGLIGQLDAVNDVGLFHHLRKEIKDDTIFNLSKRKGVYPYTYIDGTERLDEECLPPQTEFFEGGLNSKTVISDKEYDFAKKVWCAVDCKNLWDYTSFYLKVDVIGLADVFEKFRTDCLSGYGIDAVFTYSLPGFAWAAMLRKSCIDLQQITDYEMYCFFEQGIRGGLTQATEHYVKASNHYLNPEEYPSADELSRYLYLFDANGLYSWAMTQPLPYGDLTWMEDREEIEKLFPLDFSSWPDVHGECGYTLIVDLEYPESLHDYTASYPLAPSHESVDVRNYSMEMVRQHMKCNVNGGPIPQERKLLATQRDKTDYVVHFRTLEYYLKMGMKLRAVKAVVQYKQKPFMKEYIDFNITERKKWSTDKAKSDFFKKLNNAVFGKTQEQQRKHMNFKLEARREKQMAYVASTGYKGSVVFTEELVGFYMAKKKLTLKHPIYVGQAILDLSKLLMYHFFYEVIKPAFKDVSVVYTDTDSLLLNIYDDDVEKKLIKLKSEYIDGSNMPEAHPLHIMDNKGVLGKFKDEMNGQPISEVVCLRPKMYAIKSGAHEKKTAKGVNQTVVKKELNYADYYSIYADEAHQPLFVEQQTFRSKRHVIETISQHKKGLTLFDNKRFWIDANSSLPFGHYSIPGYQSVTHDARRELVLERYKEDIDKPRAVKAARRPYSYPNEIVLV